MESVYNRDNHLLQGYYKPGPLQIKKIYIYSLSANRLLREFIDWVFYYLRISYKITSLVWCQSPNKLTVIAHIPTESEFPSNCTRTCAWKSFIKVMKQHITSIIFTVVFKKAFNIFYFCSGYSTITHGSYSYLRLNNIWSGYVCEGSSRINSESVMEEMVLRVVYLH